MQAMRSLRLISLSSTNKTLKPGAFSFTGSTGLLTLLFRCSAKFVDGSSLGSTAEGRGAKSWADDVLKMVSIEGSGLDGASPL